MPRSTLGIVLGLLGYGLAYYGFQRVTGGNNTILQLFWPGKYQIVAKDAG